MGAGNTATREREVILTIKPIFLHFRAFFKATLEISNGSTYVISNGPTTNIQVQNRRKKAHMEDE